MADTVTRTAADLKRFLEEVDKCGHGLGQFGCAVASRPTYSDKSAYGYKLKWIKHLFDFDGYTKGGDEGFRESSRNRRQFFNRLIGLAEKWGLEWTRNVDDNSELIIRWRGEQHPPKPKYTNEKVEWAYEQLKILRKATGVGGGILIDDHTSRKWKKGGEVVGRKVFITIRSYTIDLSVGTPYSPHYAAMLDEFIAQGWEVSNPKYKHLGSSGMVVCFSKVFYL